MTSQSLVMTALCQLDTNGYSGETVVNEGPST